jgi:hypothetical protein
MKRYEVKCTMFDDESSTTLIEADFMEESEQGSLVFYRKAPGEPQIVGLFRGFASAMELGESHASGA